MEHRNRYVAGFSVQVDLPPVGTVKLLIEIFVEIGRGFLQTVDPVPQRQVPVPFIGQRLPKIAGLDDVLVHLGQQRLVSTARQGIPPFEYRVGHVPSPFHRSARVVHPRLVKVRRRGNRSHRPQMRRQWTLTRQRVLRGAQVALPGCGHLTGGPGLSRRPLHRIVPVQRLLEQRVVIPLGLEPPPHILAQ